jgi:hypothetical protein
MKSTKKNKPILKEEGQARVLISSIIKDYLSVSGYDKKAFANEMHRSISWVNRVLRCKVDLKLSDVIYISKVCKLEVKIPE